MVMFRSFCYVYQRVQGLSMVLPLISMFECWICSSAVWEYSSVGNVWESECPVKTRGSWTQQDIIRLKEENCWLSLNNLSFFIAYAGIINVSCFLVWGIQLFKVLCMKRPLGTQRGFLPNKATWDHKASGRHSGSEKGCQLWILIYEIPSWG